MKLCLIGFGNVGIGFVRVLLRHKAWLYQWFGFAPTIVAVHDIRRGTAISPAGLDLNELEEAWRRNLSLGESKKDAGAVIRESGADVVLELTPTDLRTGEPAASHIRTALLRQKHVVTTNKGPVALFARNFWRWPKRMGCNLGLRGR